MGGGRAQGALGWVGRIRCARPSPDATRARTLLIPADAAPELPQPPRRPSFPSHCTPASVFVFEFATKNQCGRLCIFIIWFFMNIMEIPIQSYAYDNNINIAASPTRLVGITVAPSALSRKRKPDQWVRGMGERSRWMRPHGPFHKTAGLAFLSGGRCGHRVCPLCVVLLRCLRGVLARARRGRRVIAARCRLCAGRARARV